MIMEIIDYSSEHQLFDEMMSEKVFNLHLNVAKGNMYDFVTHTWNPVKGICPHQCKYCYMRNLLSENYKCEPVLVEEKGVSMGWIMRVLDHCAWFNQGKPEKGHIVFLFQSKDPARILPYAGHHVFKHAVVATTLETNRYVPDIMGNSPAMEARAAAMEKIADRGIYTMVTAEPLMDFDKDEFVELIRQCKPRQVNIGRESTRNVILPEPTPEKVRDLVATLSDFTKVKIKKNAMTWFK